jgi:uncharacterized surface protein with fasciclin (FAS1) repeats
MISVTRSASILALSACLAAQVPHPASACKADALDIVDTAAQAGQFTTLLTAARAAGLVETLKGPAPLTVFAPTDAAFEALPDGALEKLLADKAALADVLKYHVVPGKVMAADLSGKSWAATVAGPELRVMATASGVTIDDARVVKADIAAKNGVIHVIDRVMLPRADIVATAIAAGQFKTLVTAVKAAKLVETLQGKGPFTVFAPSDAAFAKLPEGTIPALLKDEAKLASILKLHVVPGRVLSTDLPVAKPDMLSAEPKTVQGRNLSITRKADGSVTVNGAKVVKADVLADNGVIHVIDTVILPD